MSSRPSGARRGVPLMAAVASLACASPTIDLTATACAEDLGPRARCAFLTVPEDRADPGGTQLRIHVAVLPAEGAPALEPLLLFPGGPGQAATDLVDRAEETYPLVGEVRDVVMVDQRGSGLSHPLDCAHDVASDPELAFGHLWSVEKIRACHADHAERAALDFYATADYVADVADVLDALGYGPVVLWGGSGGSRTAAAFVRAYPERVRAAALDGVVPIDYPMPLPFAGSLDRAWSRVVEDCALQPDCAQAFGDLTGDLAAVVEELRAGPVPVRIERLDGVPDTVPFHLTDFAYSVRGMLYGAGRTARLPAEVHRAAETHDYAYFAQAVYGRSAAMLGEALTLGLHLGVYCREDVPRIAERDIARATGGTLLGDYLVREYREACAAWPVSPAPETWFAPFSTDVPVLMVSGRYDPVTPDAAARVAGRSFTNSVHLVVGDAGHGAGFGCAQPIVEAFLVDARLPEGDLGCPDRRIRFRVDSP